MNSYYTILYCQIRAAADEKVSVGLLLRTGNRVAFRYSHDKLTIIKELLPEPAYRLLKTSLRNMEGFFTRYEDHRISTHSKNSLFSEVDPTLEAPDFTDSTYINYLNTYSTNLLAFSKPFQLSLDKIDDTVYDKLYHQFVYESDQVLEHGSTIYDRVKKKVNPAISAHVNLDIQLTPAHIPNLVLPTRVWFIGENHVDVTGEIFDFEKRSNFLRYEIASHLNLIHALQETKKPKPNTHFLVGKEPIKKLIDNHAMWHSLRQLKYVTFVTIGELQQIQEYVVAHKVKPFVKQPIPQDQKDEE